MSSRTSRVLVVVALPGHKADERVLAERDLAVRGGGAVGDHVALLDPLALADDRPLVDAGALIGALEFDEPVQVGAALVGGDGDLVGRDRLDDARIAGDDHDAAVVGGLVFHTRKGIIAVATETTILAETSIRSILLASYSPISSRWRATILRLTNRPFSSSGSLAVATTYSSSSSAVM